MKKLKKIKSQKATSLIEYALLAALISLACVPSVKMVGFSIDDIFQGHIRPALDGTYDANPNPGCVNGSGQQCQVQQ